MIPEHRDWLLLALATAGGRAAYGQLVERMAGLRVECPSDVGPGFYRFTWDGVRPVSRELDRDLHSLIREGFVRECDPPILALTTAGAGRARSLARRVPPAARSFFRAPGSTDPLAWARHMLPDPPSND